MTFLRIILLCLKKGKLSMESLSGVFPYVVKGVRIYNTSLEPPHFQVKKEKGGGVSMVCFVLGLVWSFGAIICNDRGKQDKTPFLSVGDGVGELNFVSPRSQNSLHAVVVSGQHARASFL